MDKNLSDKLIHRLTQYHCIVTDMEEQGRDVVSSPQIADLLKIDDSQVRKDMKILGKTGKTKVGYKVSDVKRVIEKTLGFEKTKEAFIVGAGNLGLALAKYDDFRFYGFNILAMFDNDTAKINTTINGRKIYHIDNLPELVEKMSVEIAVLTVPRKYAQQTADYLVQSGIRYIWNFTPTVLKLPDNVQVWNENLIGNFLQFTKDI